MAAACDFKEYAKRRDDPEFKEWCETKIKCDPRASARISDNQCILLVRRMETPPGFNLTADA